MKFLFRKLFKKLASLEAGLLSMLLVIFFAVFAILFVAIWLAFLINTELHSRYAGFGIMAGVFILLFLFTIVLRKKSIKPFFEEIANETIEK